MEPFKTITSLAAPLDRVNVDTDQIIPKQFLKRIERSGYGEFLFFDWRRLQDGPAAGEPDPSFVLNDAKYKGAKILIAGKNFGCGSSREHAAWALTDYGFLVVIAPSFADIFHGNCFKNGILPVRLPREICDALMDDARLGENSRITVDLQRQVVVRPNGETIPFEIDAERRRLMLEGLDDIGETLVYANAIETYETNRREAQPWVPAITVG